jgi:anti-sigma regulatory factor (Ser/Thr protein kinase)
MPLRTIAEKDFIGRNHELQSLLHISSEATNGCAASLFLSGPWGVGKTELLKQLFSSLFWKQNDVVPFFYPVSSSVSSLYDFSRDYISTFIRQWLAFQTKDASLINAKELSLEKVLTLSEKAKAHWAVDIIGHFLQTHTSSDLPELFTSAISAPYQSYLKTGMPVVVVIDDFHNVKGLSGVNSESNQSAWRHFDDRLKNRHTPHIIAGSQGELRKMFFQQSSIGESIELRNLSGLDTHHALAFLNSLCDLYDLTIQKNALSFFIDLFNSNPFYMRNLIQSARHINKQLSMDDLLKIYFFEITHGKFYACWISRLKAFMPHLEQRRISLEILHYLCDNGDFSLQTNLADIFSISTEVLQNIITTFHDAGIIEINFSTMNLVNDTVLKDVIQILYSREILKKSIDYIESELITGRYKKECLRYTKPLKQPLVEIIIPAAPQAEFIGVNVLEHIARGQNISAETIKELQIALIELFSSVSMQENRITDGSFHMSVESGDDIFLITVTLPDKTSVRPNLLNTLTENHLIKRYTDDVKLQETEAGVKVTLIKRLAENTLSSL